MKKPRTWLKAATLIAVALGCYLLYEIVTFPDVARLAKENPQTTAWMGLRDSEALAKGKRPRRHQVWMSIGSVSPNLKNAVLIAEDAAFFQHEGLDYNEIKEAIKINAEKFEFARGASTITQQLAKNLYLSPSRNPLRKIRELALTLALEKHLSKKRIFEIYLNVIEWGDGVYGAEAAAHSYFGKSCSTLSEEEAAALAAVIINPRRYNPVQPNKRIRNRIGLILERMQKYRYYKG